ncbi:MAG TPA: Lrp/AsnC family transcriptional regulator [Steroidobacteraceae bacterium]|jgi:Lrp/AsnC family leucine-responsive transcriptional regulator|nr:Lrp/AsnC family transcriptional regulator [Steroidobacteraceae bacterium]
MSAAPEYELDELDRRIIAALKADGRATNQKIARSLHISPATVGARIRRLENMNAMRVVAVTDFAALGYKVLLAVGIEVQGRAAEEVARELAALEEVFAVHMVTGARDIEILVVLHDLEELETFLLRDIAKIRGIRALAAGIAADVIKYDFDRAQMA